MPKSMPKAMSEYPRRILQFKISELRRNLQEIEGIIFEETNPSQPMDTKEKFDSAIYELSNQLRELKLI
jgi:hypothetical protein